MVIVNKKEQDNVKTFSVMLVLAGLTFSAMGQNSNNPFTVPTVWPGQVPASAAPPKAAVQVGAGLNPFPPVNPKLFTATAPSQATVESFLNALWGYDSTRIWSVAGIEKTAAPGVSRITVLVTDRTGSAGLQKAVFFMTPDGKHVIASDVLPFGAQPFADMRKMMQDRADGPAKGAVGKELLFVEFADLQCAGCKTAQGTISQLARDYPQARIVFEDAPQEATHPAALDAAAYGVCVAQKSEAAFFTYAQAVYDSQDALTATGKEAALKSAAGKAGQDPEATAACAASQATRDKVQAAEKLAEDASIPQVPVLVVNGRIVPLANISYDTIDKVIRHQAELDGVTLPAPQPKLGTLQ